ncbi:MAM and LDL-receptor class A domain-containing protein 1-like [Palaemon carinicauda]|uniref:MAM and LDL-receptor class A domain-containing protein 1-like n=1 Tax=Palaemon carinicauda TaxID=392227 RepID=UPI0035B6A3F6
MTTEGGTLFLLLRILWILAAFRVTTIRTHDHKDAELSEPLDTWSCSFKDDLCNMTRHDGPDAQWKRENALPQVPDFNDHYYIIMTGEGIAGLETPLLAASEASPRCLTFYYYQNGVNPGSLSILARVGSAEKGSAVWTQGNPQGDEWVAAHADIDFQDIVSVIIEGETGPKSNGTMAVDEIQLHDEPCDVLEPTETPGEEMMCDFEDSLCGFKLEADQGNWLRFCPKTDNITFPHPSKDHTYNTGYGHYLIAPLSDGKDGVVGRVVTPEFAMEREEPQCLSFWYMHNGQTTKDTLTVYVRHGLVIFPSPVWKENGNHGYSWMWANIPIPSGKTHFEVVWEAKQQQYDKKGFMVLDDVELVNGMCPRIGTCTFQWGTCGWQNLYNTENSTDDTDWLQGKGSDGLGSDAPESDHSGSTEGKFLYNGGIGTAILESQLLVPEQHNEFCFSFWFLMDGDSGGLSISSRVESGKETKLWEETASTKGSWVLGQIKVEAKVFLFEDVAYQLYIRATRNSKDSKIALDDFSFQTTDNCTKLPVPQPTVPPTPTSIPDIWGCNFKEDICGMTKVPGFNGEWKRNNSLDQVLGAQDKWYLILSGKDSAALETQKFEASSASPFCLTFYYFFSGANAGELSIVPRHDGKQEGAVWTQGHTQGDEWVAAHADIDFTSAVSLVIEGVSGANKDGIIAVDEILLHGASCDVLQPTDTPGEELMCDFEDSMCEFEVESGVGTWIWMYPNEANHSFPHPKKDHTYSTGYGHYMAAPLMNSKEGVVGKLLTPEYQLEREAPQCLSFWYMHNGGTTKDTLSVFVKHGFDIFPQAVWKENTNHGYSWMTANIPIPTGKNHFQVIWEATQKVKDTDGFIVLDDVKLLLEECPKIGTCNFQYGTCGWQNLYTSENVTDDIDWLQGKGSDSLPMEAPGFDHTNSTEAKFLYVDASQGSFGTATLESQLLVPEQHNDFCFSFWYYIQGNIGGLIISSIVANGKETVLWQETSPTHDSWIQGQIHVQAKEFIFESVAYQLYIKGIKNNNNSKIAIDDFDFERNKECPRKPVHSTTAQTTLKPTTTTPVENIWNCSLDGNTCDMEVSDGWILLMDDHPTSEGIGLHCIGIFGEGIEGEAKIPVIDEQGNHCLTFWYLLFGGNCGELTVLVETEQSTEPLWTRGYSQGPNWQFTVVDVPFTGRTRIVFYGKQGKNDDSSLSIDEIAVLTSDCSAVLPTADPGVNKCNFEESRICGYRTEPILGDWKWLYPYADNSSVPHASVDHTYNTRYGHYMEAALVPMDYGGPVAKMVTPEVPFIEGGDQCVTFWYIHNGISNGDSLNVYVNSSGFYGLYLWREKVSYIDTWLDASVPIPKGKNNGFHVMWEVLQTQRVDHGFIAVDDVSIDMEPCSSIGTCDFENSMCGWLNVEGENRTDDTEFIRGSGSDGLDLGAPDTDHNQNPDGMVLYLDTSFGAAGEALLESQLFIPEQHSNLCFHFWYYIEGSEKDSLRIEIQSQDLTIHEIWKQTGQDSEEWHEGQVHVDAKELFIDIPFQIFIGGAKGPDYSRIAVDDFNFTKYESKDCPTIPGPLPATSTVPSETTTSSVEGITCDFTKGQCGWKNKDSEKLNWRYDGINFNMYLDPNDTAGMTKDCEALFVSPPFTVKTTSCFSLSWKKVNEVFASLKVIYMDKDGMELALLLNEEAGSSSKYQTTDMELLQHGTFTLGIQGLVDCNWGGVMAFDSVVLMDKPCSEDVGVDYIFCDFENSDKCGFHTSLLEDDGVWTWGSHMLDHTTESLSGHEVFILSGSTHDKFAHLVTPQLKMSTDNFCAKFWYFVAGPFNGSLTVYSQQGEEKSNPLWVMGDSYRGNWRGVSVESDLDKEKNLTVVWEAILDKVTEGSISLDDVEVREGSCPTSGSCSFDENLCLWTQSFEDSLNWEIVSSMGDLQDHSATNGSFLAIQTEASLQLGDYAILESPPLTVQDPACFTFWYNLWGPGIGSLTVEQSLSDTVRFKSWRLEGSKSESSSEWSYGSLPVQPSASQVMIQLKGQVGEFLGEENGQIAVDEILLRFSEECGFEPPDAEVPHVETTTALPLPTISPGFIYSCTYETKTDIFCDWTNKNSPWDVVKGSLDIGGIGPVGDHTTDTGHYATASRSPDESGSGIKISQLQSPKVTVDEESCFVFWYFTWGVDVNLTLSVNEIEEWKASSSGNAWKGVKITVTKNTEGIELLFTSSLGDTQQHYFTALDDLYFYKTTCDNVEIGGSTSFQCNLEDSDLCGWKQITDEDDTDWQLVNGTSGEFDEDHSYQTGKGHYLQLSSNQEGVKPGQKAGIMLQPHPDMTKKDYCFQIYVRYNGSHNGDINVMTMFAGEVNKFFTIPGRDGPSNWELVQQTYSHVAPGTFSFLIEGVVGNSTEGPGNSVICIDDYSLASTGCPQAGTCSFEEAHMCTWGVEKTNHVAWMLSDGLEIHGTGPDKDHTTNKTEGGYVVMDVSGAAKGTITSLISETIDDDVYGFCFTFFFSMSIDEEASLTVSVRYNEKEDLLWRLPGSNTNEWTYGQVGIPSGLAKDGIRIVINGITGSKADGVWIAVDDLFTAVGGGCSIQPADATPESEEVIFSCDFEEDTCGMTQNATDDFKWEHQNEEEPEELPPGGYILTDALYRDKGMSASISTPELVYNGLQCLSFRYRVIGSQPGVLAVHMTGEKVLNSNIWQQSDTTILKWLSAHVEIYSDAAYSLEWWTIVEGHDSIILVDDVSIKSGKCPSNPNTCDFEFYGNTSADPVCGGYLSDSSVSEYKFYRVSAAETVNAYAPEDHTYQTSLGHYVVGDFSKASEPGETVSFWGPSSSNGQNCVTFWYQFVTDDATIFRVYVNGSEGYIFFAEVGTLVDWNFGAGVIPLSVEGRIIFEAFSGESRSGYVAVDDIVVKESLTCPIHGYCEFEEDTCGWTHNRDLRWVFGNEPSGEGPLTQTYLMFVSPVENLNGSKAVLSSPTLVPTVNCVRFWYQKKEGAPGNLIMKVTPGPKYPGEFFELNLWESPADLFDMWYHAQFPIPPKDVDSIQVHFEASRTEGFWIPGHDDGLILVDDVEILQELTDCAIEPPILSTPRPATTPLPPSPSSIANCDFSEQTFCEWKNEEGHLKWTTKKYPKGTHFVGPIADHTSGDGYYMSITPMKKALQGTASLISPEILPTQMTCMRWWYHMDGSGVKDLSIIQNFGGVETTIWTRQGFQTSSWMEAFIGLSASTTYVIKIVGTQGSNPLSNIAIDDITFTDSVCPENIGTLGTNTSTCTFEESLNCGLHDSDGDGGWILSKGYAGLSDHTTLTEEGYMFVLKGKSSAITRTLTLTNLSVEKSMCLTFYYHIKADTDSSLTVWAENSKGSILSYMSVYSAIGKMGWNGVQLSLFDFFGKDFKVVIEGHIGADPDADIAVDDFFLTSGSCIESLFNCNFKDGTMCLWRSDNMEIEWYVSDENPGHILNGPISDEKYLIFETGPHHTSNSIASITSPIFRHLKQSTVSCLTFSFASAGEHSGILSVLYLDRGPENDEGEVIWQLPMTSEFTTSEWITAKVPVEITSKEGFMLKLQASTWDGREGYIAVRNLLFIEGGCEFKPTLAKPTPAPTGQPTTYTPVLTTPPYEHTEIKCDFENASRPICDFQQEVGEMDGLWVRWNASNPPSSLYPVKDHTLHSDAGHYIVATFPEPFDERVSGYEEEMTARIKTPPLDPIRDYCFSFFYHHIGDNPPIMSSYAEALEGPEKLKIWEKRNPQQDSWMYVELEIAAGTMLDKFIITIDAVLVENQDGDATLDDIKVIDTLCPTRSDTYCTFNTGLCGFSQEESEDDLDWAWHDASGGDDPFVPIETVEHFYYIYLNTKAPAGKKGIIYTSMYDVKGPQCLQLQVHSHSEGGTPNDIQIYYVGNSTIQDGILLLDNYRDMGAEWSTIQIPIEPHSGPYRLAIEGILGDNTEAIYSTLGIDDVRLTPGSCISPGACTFDVSMCSWYSNGDMGTIQWQLTGRDDVSLTTRPYADSTLNDNNGGFVLIEADDTLQGDRAWLMSEQFEGLFNAERCITFWYHLYGMDGLALSVLMRDVEMEPITVIWKILDIFTWNPGWQFASAPFSSFYTHQFSSSEIDCSLGDNEIATAASTGPIYAALDPMLTYSKKMHSGNNLPTVDISDAFWCIKELNLYP